MVVRADRFKMLRARASDGNLITNLNADLLDGYHKSDLDDEYVNVSGDTMTGDLDMNAHHIKYVNILYINDKSTGNVTDVGVIRFAEDGQSSHWHVAKCGSGHSLPNVLYFSWYDGSSWYEHLRLDPSDKVVKSRSIIPLADATYDLGTSSYRWRHGYFADDVEVDRELRVGVDADTSVDRYFHVKESITDKACARFTSYNHYGATIEINTTYTAGDQEADITFLENGNTKGSFLLETDDRRWEWWEWTGSSWHNQMYLDVNGNLYIDGTYNTFSPSVGDTEDELLIAISEEVEKPYLERGKDGRIICPVCSKPIGTGIEGLKRGDCVSGEHFRNLSKHAKDMGKITLASGKLLLKYGQRIRRLEKENQELKSRLAKIEKKLGLV